MSDVLQGPGSVTRCQLCVSMAVTSSPLHLRHPPLVAWLPSALGSWPGWAYKGSWEGLCEGSVVQGLM